jgi:dTDP-4-dehydrorhamnose reductase
VFKTVLRVVAAGETARFVDDQRGCPTFDEDLAHMLLRIGIARMPGVFHVTNQGPTTWFSFARDVLSAAGLDPDGVQPVRTSELVPRRAAARPANSVLDNAAVRASGMELLPDHHDALERAVAAMTHPSPAVALRRTSR